MSESKNRNLKTYYLIADGNGLEGFTEIVPSFVVAMRANLNSWRDSVALEVVLPEEVGQAALDKIENTPLEHKSGREFWCELFHDVYRKLDTRDGVKIIGGTYDSLCRIPWNDELKTRFDLWMSRHWKTGEMVPENWFQNDPKKEVA